MTLFKCKLCGERTEVSTRDGDSVWTVFCSPAHMVAWQHGKTEEQIIDATSGHVMPYDRCQWCACTLKSGYHEESCPARQLADELADSIRRLTGQAEVVARFMRTHLEFSYSATFSYLKRSCRAVRLAEHLLLANDVEDNWDVFRPILEKVIAEGMRPVETDGDDT